MHLHIVDYSIIVVYFLFVLGIGFALRGRMKTTDDFFLSGRSIPGWITGLAFMSANLGALEVMGHAANAAKYGMYVNHFYWLAAMPAMCFVGVFMMPFYYGSKARSVPEFLKLRYNEKTRTLNAFSFAILTLLMSGVDLYAMAILFQRLLNWPFFMNVLLSALVVLIYIYLGGLTSSIYNEVLQFFLIVFGFLPLAILGLKAVGGFTGLEAKLAESRRWPISPMAATATPGPTSGTPPTIPWASTGSGPSSGWASCSPSATGARIFSSCSAPWRPRTWPRRSEPR